MTMNSKSLSWNDRLALIEHFNPTDQEACDIFGVTKAQLDTARNMPGCNPTQGLDVESYSHMFSQRTSSTPAHSSASSTVKPSTGKPVTTTKTMKQPKKRGRKGDKIAKAFEAIPESPTPVEQFAQSHGVSIAVLRQSKRFDKSPELGNVRVKKDKGTEELMIWREED